MVGRNEEIKISPQKGNGGTTTEHRTSISHTEAGWLSLLTFLRIQKFFLLSRQHVFVDREFCMSL